MLHHTTSHYTTLHCTALHCAALHCAALRYTTVRYLQLQLQLCYFTLQYTTVHYATLIARPQYNCNYGTVSTLQRIHNYTTLQLHLQLHYTTLHPAVVGEVTNATIATMSKNTTPTTFWSISGFALASLIHNNQPFL